MNLIVAAPNEGAETTLELVDEVFAREFNPALVHQVVTSYLATGRQGSKAQKSRAEVRGGGRKPWRQKRTGRARAGSIRSPIWRGGGVTFAAKPRSFAQKVNRKMYRAAMCSILSELARSDRLRVVANLDVQTPKTRDLLGMLSGLGYGGRTCPRLLFLVPELSSNLYLAARNLPKVFIETPESLDPVSLLHCDLVLAVPESLQKLEARLT